MKSTYQVHSATEMEAFGAKLAAHASRVNRIYLRGDLGSGKTTLARGLIVKLVPGAKVLSPTFNLVAPYVFGELDLYHFDFYRIKDPEELELFGLREYFQPRSLCLVEWPERAGEVLCQPDIEVIIQKVNRGRDIQLVSYTEKGSALLSAL